MKVSLKHKSPIHGLFYHLSMGICCAPEVREPTVLDIVTEEFQQAQIDLLEAHAKSEEYSGLVSTLTKRVARLRTEMAKLSKETKENTDVTADQ